LLVPSSETPRQKVLCLGRGGGGPWPNLRSWVPRAHRFRAGEGLAGPLWSPASLSSDLCYWMPIRSSKLLGVGRRSPPLCPLQRQPTAPTCLSLRSFSHDLAPSLDHTPIDRPDNKTSVHRSQNNRLCSPRLSLSSRRYKGLCDSKTRTARAPASGFLVARVLLSGKQPQQQTNRAVAFTRLRLDSRWSRRRSSTTNWASSRTQPKMRSKKDIGT